MPYAAVNNKYLFGNALEALVGAIYLDKGYACCCRFVKERIIDPYISLDKLAGQEANFKSRLLEWGQKAKLKIDFALIETFTDEEGKPVFQTSVSIEGTSIGIGIGSTKKESQQIAAKKAFKKINRDKHVQQLIETFRQQQSHDSEAVS